MGKWGSVRPGFSRRNNTLWGWGRELGALGAARPAPAPWSAWSRLGREWQALTGGSHPYAEKATGKRRGPDSACQASLPTRSL